ncbi:hypothetical protein ERN12_09440 [Rhodobacteraceae bacterium]|nr:hypothetical protein ERN12_09440 [Paracoccaceae bacterium]
MKVFEPGVDAGAFDGIVDILSQRYLGDGAVKALIMGAQGIRDLPDKALMLSVGQALFGGI